MTVRKTTAIVVGAGPAGLAMGRELTQRGVDHVILERGRVGEAWRRRPWEQLRLRTPNWMNGLPGAPYQGRNRHGFMAATAFVERLDAYARLVGSSIEEYTDVVGIRALEPGFELSTTDGLYRCRVLILATGACAQPKIPALAAGVPSGLFQTTPAHYRRHEDLPEGRVLVVGAASSGVAIAGELQSAGRNVILAVGNHTRLPRRYRGRDIKWWLDAIGWLDERVDAERGVAPLRPSPSPQLSGSLDPTDIGSLQARGVEVVGRLVDVRDGHATFCRDLATVCAAADLELSRLCARIDTWAARHMASGEPAPTEPMLPTPLPASQRLSLDLNADKIAAVVWATGFRPDHSFVHLPVFDRHDQLLHEGGAVTGVEGLYVLGLPSARRRRSGLICGVGREARDIAEHLERCLKTLQRREKRRGARRRSLTPCPARARPTVFARGA